MVYFDHILHTYAWQNCTITTMQNRFCEGRGFAKVIGNIYEMFVFGCVKVCLNVTIEPRHEVSNNVV